MEQQTSSGGLCSSQGTDELLPSPNVRPVKMPPNIAPSLYGFIKVVASVSSRQNILFDCRRDIAPKNPIQLRLPHTSSERVRPDCHRSDHQLQDEPIWKACFSWSWTSTTTSNLASSGRPAGGRRTWPRRVSRYEINNG